MATDKEKAAKGGVIMTMSPVLPTLWGGLNVAQGNASIQGRPWPGVVV